MRPRVPLPLDEALRQLFSREGLTVVGGYPRWSIDLCSATFLVSQNKGGAYWTIHVKTSNVLGKTEREDALYDEVVRHLEWRKKHG